MDWNDVRHFLALARLGSVRAAGASLGVSHSTVARRVDALEAELGARLFDRHRDGYQLTDAGREMLPGAERVEREFAALERGLVGQDDRLEGSARVTCCDNYVASFLVEELGALCDEHPGIRLELGTDSRSYDLSKREADVALRILPKGAAPPGHLLGRRLAPICVASYVARAHHARLDPALQPSGGQPSEARWIGYDDDKQMRALVEDSSYPGLPIWGAFGNLDVVVHATKCGFGVAMLPTHAGDSEPTLRRLEKADVRHVAELWLLSHPDLRDNTRLRHVRERTVRAFERRAALFEA